ncbi:MAG TPA: hypothetical protein VG892_11700 [Terriglobales bacterium]|jgi:hypothetical protein|nr:hypothetical protein [Terriglobales bacterium]
MKSKTMESKVEQERQQAEKTPAKESERPYPKLSPEAKERVLENVKRMQDIDRLNKLPTSKTVH